MDRETHLERAQALAYDAMEATTRREKIAKAKEALAISIDCADAYSVLAWEANNPEDALAFYRQAVEAGERAIGPAGFKAYAGHFWLALETRPYMRARHGLALALWEAGERDESVVHYDDLLRLNPNDNQGIRYSLIDALLFLGRDKQARDLLKSYKDEASAAWGWSRALLAFRAKGASDISRRALSRAAKANPHVAAYLLERKPLPRNAPEFIGVGDESEAAAYVQNALASWKKTDGAREWVASVLSPTPVRDAGAKQAPSQDAENSGVNDRIDDAVIALLLLSLHDGDRAWKTFDWETMDRLHAKGLISSPASRTKSVVLSDEGLKVARESYHRLFVQGVAQTPTD